MTKKRVIVIKYGGAVLENDAEKKELIKDVIFLTKNNFFPVLVHGGGVQVTRMLDELGIKSRFVRGMRYTDKKSLEIVEMVLSAKINKSLVAMVNGLKGKAVGLSGKDGCMVIAGKAGGNLGLVGEVKKVNTELLELLLKNRFIPVISSIGMTDTGETLNINADMMAQAIAIALQAQKLIFLTDVEGVIHQGTVLNKIKSDNVSKLINKKVILGGMIPKVKASVGAIKKGVGECRIVNARTKHILALTVLKNQNKGTIITR